MVGFFMIPASSQSIGALQLRYDYRHCEEYSDEAIY